MEGLELRKSLLLGGDICFYVLFSSDFVHYFPDGKNEDMPDFSSGFPKALKGEKSLIFSIFLSSFSHCKKLIFTQCVRVGPPVSNSTIQSYDSLGRWAQDIRYRREVNLPKINHSR